MEQSPWSWDVLIKQRRQGGYIYYLERWIYIFTKSFCQLNFQTQNCLTFSLLCFENFIHENFIISTPHSFPLHVLLSLPLLPVNFMTCSSLIIKQTYILKSHRYLKGLVTTIIYFMGYTILKDWYAVWEKIYNFLHSYNIVNINTT